MGIFDLGDHDLDRLMPQDEEISKALDRERFAEVTQGISANGALL